MVGVAHATLDVAAPPERVYRALTDPAERARWWGADAPAGPDTAGGAERDDDGPRVVEFTWRAGWDGRPPGLVRYELVPAEVDGVAGTRVRVTHTGPAFRAGAGAATCMRPAGDEGLRAAVASAPPRHAPWRAGVRPAWLTRRTVRSRSAWTAGGPAACVPRPAAL